jgi:hypothetical protein
MNFIFIVIYTLLFLLSVFASVDGLHLHEYITSFVSALVAAGCAWEIHKQCPEEKEIKLYRAKYY